MTTAKLFWNGNSQAVRLPKEFRFMGNMVNIRKQGRQVIIEPIETDWAWLDDLGEPAPHMGASNCRKSPLAGQAIAQDLVLITHNVKEFERVENLRFENWL